MKPFAVFPAIMVLLALMMASCGERRPEPYDPTAVLPADSLISPEKMALILSDIHLAEAGLQLDRNRGEASGTKPSFFYEGIYRKYNITAELYAKNLRYYTTNPELYVKVYEKVIGILEQKQPGKATPAPQ